jgi:hypothetical protein
MKGIVISARDKLMYVLVLTIILFIGAIATVVIDPPYFGIMLILFDFLLAVIILLSATAPDESQVVVTEGNLVHQGRNLDTSTGMYEESQTATQSSSS